MSTALTPVSLVIEVGPLLALVLYFWLTREQRPLSRPRLAALLVALAVPLAAGLALTPHYPMFTLLPFLAVMVHMTLDLETALFLSLLVSGALAALLQGVLNPFYLLIYNTFVGWTAAFTATYFHDRYSIYRIVVIVAAVAGFLAFALWLEQANPVKLATWTVFSALLSGLLVLGVLPLYERFFQVSTDFLLLELSNTNAPLLRELAQRAPGTFTHSLNVAHLAEAAARALGINPLLARVAALYHDIGKLKNPHLFIENQMGSENPHDALPPEESVRILVEHVTEGLKMAQQYGLPREIVGVIQTHHGTSLIRPFFAKALESQGEVKEDAYRYPGPRPRNKLEALIMLADSVEAAIRSLKNPTLYEIRTLTHQVLEGKWNEGQLDDTDLTRKDLGLIEEAFLQALKGIFHPRIEYPEVGQA